jgi:hypothetical protein
MACMSWARCKHPRKMPLKPRLLTRPTQRLCHPPAPSLPRQPLRPGRALSQARPQRVKNHCYLEFPVAMAGSNKEEYVCSSQCASATLFIRQQIIESFNLHDRHDHAEALLVMREIVHHRFVRNEPPGHGHSNIDRLTSRQSLFQLATQRC